MIKNKKCRNRKNINQNIPLSTRNNLFKLKFNIVV